MMDFPNEATIVSKLDLHRCVPSIDTSCDSNTNINSWHGEDKS